jgi:hypothetical protein
MMAFTDYLHERLEAGGFTTEDALASVLPLIRQVAAAHAAGLVAPLQGINDIHVDKNQLWFEDASSRKPAFAGARLRELERLDSRAVEVVGRFRLDVQVEEGTDTVASMQIGTRGEPITRPVYLPGYVSWEHEIGHHDPLTDIYALGLILASCAAGLDLNDPVDLTAFVRHRRNLFELNPLIHPVLAKTITRMTELQRARRPQDAQSLQRVLENYRDQDVDLDSNLARAPEFKNADHRGKRAIILSCLQQRLFDISRRNRLLHFRATGQTVNLTWASVPLSFDVQNVRPEQILTWGHAFKEVVTAGDPVSLNKYLRFEEALYLPGQLDEIRNEARRDQTEYGFAQLRLVVCFLRWANLKEKPPLRYDSPLVLLPVRLTKTKGVRDVFTLEPAGTEAEINPVLRFYLKQLYAVDLPESIDLAKESLDDLHAHIAAKVQASEPAVTVEKIDKPRINLIQASARRRLEQYRRRLRLSGRGVRSFLDIDYCYERTNYHPLGLRLFQTRIAPAEPRLRTLIEESPRPRTHMTSAAESPLATKERQLYSQAEEETNPFHWEFDLCNLTLSNFHYRKMSLVRDYSALLEENNGHQPFDTIFSLDPREVPADAPQPLPLDDSYPVVNCDPTQASAIALARKGGHFIIQGPPGTGKSQTISNLIADFVARGKRVLFVCEKRAAIDVVYHRLHRAGLHELCSLIHDAQEDKKEFIFDLKATYEAFLAAKEDQATKTEQERGHIVDRLKTELQPLERYDAAMRSAPASAGLPLHQLLQRSIALAGQAPDLAANDSERLPPFQLWRTNADAVDRLCDHLQSVQPDGVLAKHPLRRLNSRFGQVDRPLEAIRQALPSVERLTDKLQQKVDALALPADCNGTLGSLEQLVAYAESLLFLAEHELLDVLVAKSDPAKRLKAFRKKVTAKEQELRRAQTATVGWRKKLSPTDTTTALQQMRGLENSIARFLSPGFWRWRGILRSNYDFASDQAAPVYSRVLERLQEEHQVAAEIENLTGEARDEFFFEGTLHAFSDRVAALVDGLDSLPACLQSFHHHVVTSERDEAVQTLAELKPTVARLLEEASALFASVKDLSLAQLGEEMRRISDTLGELPEFVPCLKELAVMPPPLADAWRHLPLRAEELEAAMARHTSQEVLRAEPSVARFNSGVQATHLTKLQKLHDQWHSANAKVVRERQCQQFLEHVRTAALPHAQLTAEQKEFKVRYNRGRRELEHEFNKTMRFRSIRDLFAGDSGLVLQDLKPVWLMSPLSVSDTLPLMDFFDVVIFDEASQVTLEESVPAIFRAKQVLVVGDEMQLPPTSFFASKGLDEEERLLVEDPSGQQVEYDLSSNSFLNHAARNLPATMLGWHYRSRSESLISFSNAAFYRGRLLTVPEVALPPADVAEIAVQSPDEGGGNVDRLLERPLSFHFLEDGVYEHRRNPSEAQYIARLVRGLLSRQGGLSIGIVAFSEAQQGEIEEALRELARTDDEFRDRLDAEWEREEEGQFVGLLVKNLENIQGDERDIIILSVCYGYTADRKMLMNFGPINQQGGERRLNVAFSRAKKYMALVTSIRHAAITNDYNDGARALKNYLRYAEACSRGDDRAARRVLWEINPADSASADALATDVVVDQLAGRLRERGWQVETDVGHSGFRCNLAVRARGQRHYCLGILVDTESYYQNSNILDRDLLRPQLLRDFGWNVVMVLTKNWFENANAVMQGLVTRLDGGSEIRE